MDISDFDGLDDIKEAYLETDKEMEYVPMDGVYAMPYMANASGVLYNKDMFEEHGWTIPTTWDEFTALCERIEAEGIQPLYFGFKDSWTCLAPWNAIAADLAPSDVCSEVKGIPHLPIITEKWQRKKKRFWHMPRTIRQHTDTTMRVQHLPKVSLRCL